MKTKRLYSTLCISYVTIIIICVLAVAVYAGVSLRKHLLSRLESDAVVQAKLASQRFLLIPQDRRFVETDAICKQIGQTTGTRITIVDRSGVVLGDSIADPGLMDNHGSRPEIVGALETGLGKSIRFSKTLKKMMFYVAIPIVQGGKAVYAVRVAVPEQEVSDRLWTVYAALGLGALIAAVVALVVGGLIARAIVKPLEALTDAARRLGAGELDARVQVSTDDELGLLSRAFNEMADSLEANVEALEAERNEREAILASMEEGVITVHTTGKILLANDAFKEMIGAEGENVEGRTLIEAVRSVAFDRFVKRAQGSAGPMDTELTLDRAGHRVLSIHAAPLMRGNNVRIGTLIVARDVTEMRRLEEVRKSFVANVSHELKTPITLIKGYVETLLDGPLDEPKKLPEFLSKVKDHADRMNAIIDDLLQLSALEVGHGKNERGLVDLVVLARRVKRSFADAATKKGIELVVDAPDFAVRTSANESLIEQAIANLVDNAVKYTDEGGHIRIEVSTKDNRAILSVADDGIGIEKRHIGRIFERFYRVDKGRSRQLGGTGLGLSIVKHIVASHGGTVSVKSQPGQGSTFTISLPAE